MKANIAHETSKHAVVMMDDWLADVGVDAYKFYEFWGVVATKLHPHNKRVGTCIETAPANVSHPWCEQ